MADKNVDINIRTKADSREVKKYSDAHKELDETLGKEEIAINDVKVSADKLRKSLDSVDKEGKKVFSPADQKRIKATADQLDNVARTADKVSVAQQKNGRQTRNTGLAFLEFSRAVEDAQYGVRGILNNIPQMVLLMGGGGGLAGVISIAAVAMSQLFEQMSKVTEETPEAKARVEELKQGLEDLHKEIGREDFEAYLDRFRQMDHLLSLENTALRANVALLEQKRQGQLKIAAIQDNIDLANIAQRQASDPSYTSEQANADRQAIKIRQLARDRENAEIQQEQEREKAHQQLIDARNAEIEVQRKIVILKKKQEEDDIRLAELKRKAYQKAEFDKKAEELRGKTEGFGGFVRNISDIVTPGETGTDTIRKTAQEAEDFGRSILSVAEEGELIQIQESVKGSEKVLDDLQKKLISASEKVKESTLNVGIVDKASKELDELAKNLESKSIELIQIQDSTKRAQALSSEIAGGIADLGGLSEGLADDRAFEKRAIEDITKLYQEKLSDGILDANDISEIQRVASQFALSLGGLKTDTGKAVGNLQSSLESLILQVSTLNARQIKIDSATKKLEAQVQASKGR